MRPLAEPVQAANMPTDEQDGAQRDGVVHLRRHGAEDDGTAQAGEQHGALADAVDDQAPQEQRDHHPGDRHRGERAGLGQGQSAVLLQGRGSGRPGR